MKAEADVGGELAVTAMVLARRFAAGATLWCLAPRDPAHARHVAVEFVHPVITGTRALPAVAVTAPDPVADLRAAVRPGDVLLAVSRADDAVAADALRRAPAWGVDSIWIVPGGVPAGTAEGGPQARVIAVPDDAAAIVRTYHLLWELTHVCFEHPGLLAPRPPDVGSCPTCGDEARVGEVRVAGTDGDDSTVIVDGTVERVATALVGATEPGDLVLVHAGIAIARLDDGA